MKIKKKYYLWLCLLCTLTVKLQAQEVVTTSGGYGETTGARVTWTIGEPVTETICGTNIILTQGFNQGNFIITIVKDPDEYGITLKVFPNPAHDRVRISSDNTKLENLRYILFDISGRVLKDNILLSPESEIPVRGLNPSIYLLKVYQGTKEIGVFKIVKK
jgi:hypothetical protein